MRKTIVTVFTLLVLALPAMAQDAKNVYEAELKPRQAGRPHRGRIGAMVRIEYKEQGQGKPAWVSSKKEFRSGDAIRLHVKVNRGGYLMVLNQGTDGALQLIYPKTPEQADSQVLPTLDFTIPATPGRWLTFDRTAGTERMVILLSAIPTREMLRAMASAGEQSGGEQPSASAQGQSGSQGGAAVSTSQEQEIADALNSKVFRAELDKSTSKNFTETEEATAADGGPAVYAVPTSSNADLRKPVVYKLALTHRP